MKWLIVGFVLLYFCAAFPALMTQAEEPGVEPRWEVDLKQDLPGYVLFRPSYFNIVISATGSYMALNLREEGDSVDGSLKAKTIFLDGQTGEMIQEIDWPVPLATFAVAQFMPSEDEVMYLWMPADRGGRFKMRILNWWTGEDVYRVEDYDHPGYTTGIPMFLSPQGYFCDQELVSDNGRKGNNSILIDSRTGRTVSTIEGEVWDHIIERFDRDAKHVLTVNRNNRSNVKVWEVETGELVQVFAIEQQERDQIRDVIIMPDGEHVRMTMTKPRVLTWSIATGGLVADQPLTVDTHGWQLTPDGEYLVKGHARLSLKDGTQSVWYPKAWNHQSKRFDWKSGTAVVWSDRSMRVACFDLPSDEDWEAYTPVQRVGDE